MAMKPNLLGPGGRLFAEQQPGKDEVSFRVDNTSEAYYNSPYYELHKNDLQQIPAPRKNVSMQLQLADFTGPAIISAIQQAGKITFHSVGDTGAAKVNREQTVERALQNEEEVADAMAKDVATGGPDGPAFFFHLGDVIYNFGEAQYYYDQFYDPYRAYDRPIFAIPGNHDGMVFGQGSSAPQVPTLDAFLTNFCAADAAPSPDAGGLMRSVMTQPGVYFRLDAPFVSILGLYSNVLDSGPGVISSQGGHFPLVDDQLDFLKRELANLKPERAANKRAVIIAVHHPPLSADAKHGGSLGIGKDLDACCKAAGLYPDALLCGHAHLYQRFTRVMPDGKEIPYVVAGSGGFAATTPKALPPPPITIGDHTLVIAPIVNFGYLTIETDARTLSLTFKTADERGVVVRDSVVVDLAANKILAAGQQPAAPPAGRRAPAARKKKPPAKPARPAKQAKKAKKRASGRKSKK